MTLNEILNKTNPVPKNREMSKSEYLKLVDRNTELIDDINELNNIINELEKYIEESYKYNSKCLSTIFEARAFEDNKILDKLQELKGENK